MIMVIVVIIVMMMMMIIYSLNHYIDIFQFLLLFLVLPFHCLSNPWVLSGACGSVWWSSSLWSPLPWTPLYLYFTHSIWNIFLYHRLSQITLPALLALQTRTLSVTEASSGALWFCCHCRSYFVTHKTQFLLNHNTSFSDLSSLAVSCC